MAIFNPIRKQFTRATRPQSELTGDAVSRAARQIERELNKGGNESLATSQVTGARSRALKPSVTVDEVRLFSNGQDLGFSIKVTPTVLHTGDHLNLKLDVDIT